MNVRQVLRRLIHPGRPSDCVAHPVVDVAAPSEEEIAAVRKGYRDEIHKNRNNITVSVQIARRMQRASKTMLDAANEMVEEIQKTRERIH